MKKIQIFLLAILGPANINWKAFASESTNCAHVTEIQRKEWPYNQNCDCSNDLHNKHGIEKIPGLTWSDLAKEDTLS